ncbi:MAG: catalase family peroxidase [Steroidobacteraceae bacterium]
MATTPTPRYRSSIAPLAGIALIVGLVAFAFAWTAGWIGGGRLTAAKMIDAIEANNPQQWAGYRRAHSKGVCFRGEFQASGKAASLSVARAFTQQAVPVIGRLSIAGGDPHGPDNTARVRSISALLKTDDGQEWRMAMNEFPFFPVASPEGFQALTLASHPDPATGKPDPAAMAAFVAKYPEIRNFQAWAGSAPFTDSWATTTFNGVNSFRLRAADGTENHVRWSMRPQAVPRALTPEELTAADGDFLEQEILQRLRAGPARWDMVVTIAEAGDAVDDPSQTWPAERKQVVAGTLVISSTAAQATGECRDINFDPLVLPQGVAPSSDPVLLARSTVYAESFNRREMEIAHGKAAGATGTESAK